MENKMITMKTNNGGEIKMEVFKRVITHSTVFHADDVFGVAMWKLINPDIEVVRTLEPEKFWDENTIVFDIGMGKYDHHQEDKALREDGTPYCGFGLLWRDYGCNLCPELDAWKKVDRALVLPIDKADNGVEQNTLSISIKAMNPNWNSEKTADEAFFEAVDVAKAILKAYVDHANAAVEAIDAVLESYLASPGEEILVLDEYLPWTEAVISEEKLRNVLFTVYPSQRGGWNVQTVPKATGTFTNRMDFPKDWLGHADPERGIHFAHTANFLIACDTKEQAIKVAEEAIEAGKTEYTVVASV